MAVKCRGKQDQLAKQAGQTRSGLDAQHHTGQRTPHRHTSTHTRTHTQRLRQKGPDQNRVRMLMIITQLCTYIIKVVKCTNTSTCTHTHTHKYTCTHTDTHTHTDTLTHVEQAF